MYIEFNVTHTVHCFTFYTSSNEIPSVEYNKILIIKYCLWLILTFACFGTGLPSTGSVLKQRIKGPNHSSRYELALLSLSQYCILEYVQYLILNIKIYLIFDIQC